MEFGVLVILVGNERYASFQVFFNQFVHLAHRLSLIIYQCLLLGFGDIGDAWVGALGGIGLCPDVNQHEVEVGSQQERFAIKCFYARTFGVGREQFQCFVGLGDAFVAGIPIVKGRV